jgi:hypothetical protein
LVLPSVNDFFESLVVWRSVDEFLESPLEEEPALPPLASVLPLPSEVVLAFFRRQAVLGRPSSHPSDPPESLVVIARKQERNKRGRGRR